MSANGYISSIPSEYITQAELSANSYLTAVPSEYITDTELSSMGYLTSVPSDYPTYAAISAMGYVTSVPTIDENIIPKATDTYTLGSGTYFYHTLYANRIQGNSTVNVRTGSNNRATFSSSAFRPMQQNYDLGSSDYKWNNFYAYNAYISNYTFPCHRDLHKGQCVRFRLRD